MDIYDLMLFIGGVMATYCFIFTLGFIIGNKVKNQPIIAKYRLQKKQDKPSTNYDRYKSTNGKYAPTKIGSGGKGNKSDEIKL